MSWRLFIDKEKKNRILFYLAEKLLWLVILFFGGTGRIRAKYQHRWKKVKKSGKPVIIVLWHGKMLLPMYIHRSLNLSVMVSRHRDGEMIARTVHRIGYRTVRGSSTRGGSTALRQMVRRLKNGNICVILPDGPKGPRHQVKMGIVMMAQLAGAMVIPFTFSAAKPIIFNSWDRFTLWWPFSKLAMVYGKPIEIPRRLTDEQMEEYRLLIENSLNNLQKEADELFQS